jgi:hypothetical protein
MMHEKKKTMKIKIQDGRKKRILTLKSGKKKP